MIKISEIAGKVGAFYACSGTGTFQAAEAQTLKANGTWTTYKNVIAEQVFVASNTATEWKRWTCTPMGHLTVEDAGASAAIKVKYRYWHEVGEVGTAAGIIKQYGGFFNWTIDQNCDTVDITAFEDSGHRAFLATLDGWTASAERHWVDEGLFPLIGSETLQPIVIAKFYVNDSDDDKGIGSDSETGDRYEGYCIVTGMSPSLAVDTLLNESLNFQGTAQLVYES